MNQLINFLVAFIGFFLGFVKDETGSVTIPEAMIEGYNSSLYFLSQQKAPRLYGKSQMREQASETDYYERIGAGEANDSNDRHGDTPINNAEHSRRAVDLTDADWGDLVDRFDKLRLLIAPEGAYVKTGVMALNRKKDDIFIAAILGVARAGKRGTTLVSLPESQKLVAVASETGAVETGLNVYTLTKTSEKFDEADVDEDEERYFAYSSRQKQNLLRQTEVTSADYNTVKALVQGKVNSFMGFEFIRSQRLPVAAAAVDFETGGQVLTGAANTTASTMRRCVAWCGDGMISADGINLESMMAPRPDKKWSIQVYVRHSVGAVRMEEEKVVEVLCAE